jgi:hypothetical protein
MHNKCKQHKNQSTAIGDYHHGAPPHTDPMRTGNIELQQQYP